MAPVTETFWTGIRRPGGPTSLSGLSVHLYGLECSPSILPSAWLGGYCGNSQSLTSSGPSQWNPVRGCGYLIDHSCPGHCAGHSAGRGSGHRRPNSAEAQAGQQTHTHGQCCSSNLRDAQMCCLWTRRAARLGWLATQKSLFSG